MKEKLSKFADGGAELLSRHGGFYLCFFLFNCLTMCLHMVSKNKTDVILKKKEINYYNMNDKNNIINVFILIVMIGLFLALLYYAFISFINGNFFGCIWVVAYSSSLFVPGIKDRLTQAVNFIKRKMK